MSTDEQHPHATLRGVARVTGVDISTVSRVLNGSPEDAQRAASKTTADKIRKVAAKLHYQPNPHATSLRTRRSNLIGVLVPRLSDLVLATIYEGIEDAAAKHQLTTFVMNSHDDPDKQRARTDMALSRRVDGLIFGDAHANGRFLAEITGRGVPFVLVNRHVADYPSVTCDDYEGGRLVAEHFLHLGHRTVAVIAGEPFASTGIDRTRGFVDRYREAGIRIPAARIVPSHFHTSGGRHAAEQLLQARTPPMAIFAVNDFAAIGALGALRDHGLRPGKDIAVAGFNDTPLASELPIPLTSVHSPLHQMGVEALELLLQLLTDRTGKNHDSRRLRPELVIRASTDPAQLPTTVTEL